MKTIAIVDDEPDNRLLLQYLLGELYRTVEYENGIDALAGMRRQPPDLVLLDIWLKGGGMDGNEVLRHIRAEPSLRGLPVVALTAHAMAGDRERYLAQGFDHYVAKPIDIDQLPADIERLLSRRRT